MTQRKKIAFAYVFAVPIVLALVIFQHTALSKVFSDAGGIEQSADVLHELDSATLLLKEADTNTQRTIAGGGDETYKSLYQDNVSHLHIVLDHLRELTNREKSSQLQFKTLEPLVAQQISLFQEMMDLNKKGAARAPDQSALDARSHKFSDQILTIISNFKSAQYTDLQQQKETAGWNIRVADTLTTLGGTLIIWLIGVAAFLLFHDEKKSNWDGVERRIHTIILQVLPLGVSMTTDNGLILYTNPAEETAFGYQPGELIGKNAVALHTTVDGGAGHAGLGEIFEQLESTQMWSGEISIVRKDGTNLKTVASIINMIVPGKGKEFSAKLFRVLVHNFYQR